MFHFYDLTFIKSPYDKLSTNLAEYRRYQTRTTYSARYTVKHISILKNVPIRIMTIDLIDLS